MKKILLLLMVVCCNVKMFSQKTDIVVDNQTPGWLSSKISYSDQQTVRNLKVTGFVNATDLKFIGSLISSQSLDGKLDLYDCNIVKDVSEGEDNLLGSYLVPSSNKNLKVLIIPQSATMVEGCTGKYLYVDSLFFDCQMTTISQKCFGGKYTKLGHLEIGENVTEIPKEAFCRIPGTNSEVKIKSVQFPSSIISIGDDAFSMSELESCNFNDLVNLEELGRTIYNAAYNFKEYRTFGSCSPDTIIVPSKLSTYPLTAFFLKEGVHVFLSNSTSTLSGGTSSRYEFSHSGEGITFHINQLTPPEITWYKNSYWFEGATIYVPKGAAGAYNSSSWSNTNIIETSTLESIKLNEHDVVLGLKETFQLSTKLFPEDAYNTIIQWKSEDANVASVNQSGKVTAVSSGTTNIIAQSSDGLVFDNCKVIVKDNWVLTINVDGGGSVAYGTTTIKNQTSSFTVEEGTSATLSFTPDEGYRIASVKVNGTDVTSDITNNQYTISGISANTSVEILYEAIPPTTYTLSIKSSGNGSVIYGTATIKNQTKSFTVEEGASVTLSFTPNAGSRIASVKVNGTDVTSSVTDNQLILNNVKENLVIDVSFGDLSVGDLFYAKTVEGVLMTFKVTDAVNKTCQVGNGTNPAIDVSTTGTVTIPSEVNGYKVNEIGKKAFWNSYFYVNRFILPEGIISIGNWAFYQESSLLEAINIPSSVQTIGDRAFANCNHLKYVYINDLKSWCNISFEGVWSNPICYAGCLYINNQLITNLQIPEGVTKLNSNAFIYYKLLNTVTLPSTLASIGASAFSYCENLSTVVSNIISPYSISDDVFREISSDCILYVPKGTKSKYEEYSGWTQQFKEIIEEKEYCNLTIISSGNGGVTYGTTTIKNQTKSFTVEEGTSATLSFAPDAGYRITSVKVNGTDVTSSVSDNQYTISGISANTSIEVVFDAIPPTTYTLSIKSSGSGSVTYGTITIKNQTKSFTVEEGTSATLSFTPDAGYRIASVKVDGTDVTSSITNNQYTISSVSANTSIEVVFDAIPPTTYTLSVKSSGSGSVTYGTTTIKNQTKSFTVEEGTSVTLSFSPDASYRIASVKVNGKDVTSDITNNQYTISSISANTSVEVAFEAIPPTTYTLSIKSSGSGYALYSSTTVREKTSTFTVTGGTSAQISLVPDEGYRVANVKVNNVDVTGAVSNNRYVISSITENTSMEVVFEAIPPTTYSLSIKAIGNGTVMYGNVTLKNQTQSFTVIDGSYAAMTITPENGYRIKHVLVNNQNVTSNISNNQYIVSSIHANTTVEVEFEEIPITTFTLTIKASGNGNIYYNNVTIKNQSKQYMVNEGVSVTITFSPDNGNSVNSVKVNGSDVTSAITGNRYFIESMTANTSVEVTFVEDVNALTVEGINYTVISQSQKTVKLAGGNIGQVLTVPASITQNGIKWTITEIDNSALVNNAELAAIIWNPSVPFTAEVNNPNMLLYVTDEQYAPTSIKNVIVNGIASNITLVDAASGNDFYCPQAFTAQKISYTHNYNMMTGLGESRGWETISLPFDVQTYTHVSKGNIVPFAIWKSGDTTKPFWLYELMGSGFVEAAGIKAYTPYIISLPNNPQYDEQWKLNGTITFSASSVTIGKTEDMKTANFQDRTFVPNFASRDANEGFYALNAVNDYTVNNSGMSEGSRFVLNMRHIHPFEAYMTSTSNSRMFIDIFEGMTTDIRQIQVPDDFDNQPVYNLQGQRIQVLKNGVYIINGNKYIKK